MERLNPGNEWWEADPGFPHEPPPDGLGPDDWDGLLADAFSDEEPEPDPDDFGFL